MSINWEKTNCDLCGNNNLEQINTSYLCTDTSKNSWQDVFFDICPNCGLIFENPRMLFELMKNYYSQEQTSNVNYAMHSDGSYAREQTI